jgi:hypothetical protein
LPTRHSGRGFDFSVFHELRHEYSGYRRGTNPNWGEKAKRVDASWIS